MKGMPAWVTHKMQRYSHLGKTAQGIIRKELLKEYRALKVVPQ